MRTAPRLLRLGLLGAALALSACGAATTTIVRTDTSPAHPSTRSAPPRTTTSRTASEPATTTAPGAATTSTALPECTAEDLALGYLGGRGATGHGEVGFSLTNTTGRSCHTYGFPGVLFLSASGASLPTRSVRATHDFFGSVAATGLTVAPHGVVSFRLTTSHGEASDAGCTTARRLQVIPPNDTHTLVVAIPNGVYECGSVTVSPLAAGTRAFS